LRSELVASGQALLATHHGTHDIGGVLGGIGILFDWPDDAAEPDLRQTNGLPHDPGGNIDLVPSGALCEVFSLASIGLVVAGIKVVIVSPVE